MHTNWRAVCLYLVATTVLVVATSLPPAAAQSTTDDTYTVKASRSVKFTRYYAPYAIQAAAAYLPVKEFEDRKSTTDALGYGDDVKYAVQNIFGGDSYPARQAIKTWQYQFGSDSYLTCYDSTDTDCQRALLNKGWDFGSGPSFQVWARSRVAHAGRVACSEVSIAFRGTVGLNSGDWYSNADRFGSPYDDYYHQLRRNIDGIISTIKRLPCYRGATQIVSTGHSLGGGLAQLAALANKPTGPRISKVFAFDPSPVTGAHLVDKQLLNTNAAGLTIDRIYQEGEVLSYARNFIQEFPPAGSACRPYVRTVKVDAVSGSGAVGLHGMNPLAVQIVGLSYDGDMPQTYLAPPSPGQQVCGLRYRPPATDGNGTVVAGVATRIASARARRALYASSASGQGENPDRFSPSFGAQQSDPATELKEVTTHRAEIVSDGRRSKKLRVANSL